MNDTSRDSDPNDDAEADWNPPRRWKARGWHSLPCGSMIRNVPGGVVMAVAASGTVFVPACTVAHFELVPTD